MWIVDLHVSCKLGSKSNSLVQVIVALHNQEPIKQSRVRHQASWLLQTLSDAHCAESQWASALTCSVVASSSRVVRPTGICEINHWGTTHSVVVE